MTRIKDATFEGASLTGTNGFTSTTGTPALDSSSKIKGTYSCECSWVNATKFGTVSSLSISDLYISFLLIVHTTPGSTVRLCNLSNGTSQFCVSIDSSGRLLFRNGSTTVYTGTGLTTDTIYRIGIRQKVSTGAGSGNADSIVEFYWVADGAAWGTPAYSASNAQMATSNAAFTSVTLGNTNSSTTTGDIFVDNLRIDDAALPTDDIAGGTDTPKAITVTTTASFSGVKTVGHIVPTITVTDVASMLKNVGHIIPTIAKTVTASMLKTIGHIIPTITKTVTANMSRGIGKILSFTESIIATVSTGGLNFNQAITVTVSALTSLQRNLGKITRYSIITNTTESSTNNRLLNITVAATILRSVQKTIGKPVNTSITASLLITKNILKSFLLTTILQIQNAKGLYKTISTSVATHFSLVYGKGYSQLVSVVVSLNIQKQKTISKTISVVVALHKFITSVKDSIVTAEFLQVKKNVAAITLTLKSTARTIFGKNTNTLIIGDTDNDNI